MDFPLVDQLLFKLEGKISKEDEQYIYKVIKQIEIESRTAGFAEGRISGLEEAENKVFNEDVKFEDGTHYQIGDREQLNGEE